MPLVSDFLAVTVLSCIVLSTIIMLIFGETVLHVNVMRYCHTETITLQVRFYSTDGNIPTYFHINNILLLVNLLLPNGMSVEKIYFQLRFKLLTLDHVHVLSYLVASELKVETSVLKIFSRLISCKVIINKIRRERFKYYTNINGRV